MRVKRKQTKYVGVYGLKTTAMHDSEYTPPCPAPYMPEDAIRGLISQRGVLQCGCPCLREERAVAASARPPRRNGCSRITPERQHLQRGGGSMRQCWPVGKGTGPA